MQGDRLHAAAAVLGLGVGIVVRVRVDVVGVCAALRVGNELDASNPDVVRGQEGLPGRNEGVIEAWHDLEPVVRRNSRTGLAWLLDLAGISRAKLEALGGVDSDGIQQLTADELDARDERLGRLDVALDEHDAVNGVLKGFTHEMLLKRGLRVDQLDAKPLAGTVVLENDRIADSCGSARNVLPANSRDGGGGLDAEPRQALVLGNLGDFQLEGALAIDDGAPMFRKPCEHGGSVFGCVAMFPRVRGSAHPVVEDSLGGWRCEVDQTAVEKPLRERGIDGGKLASQRFDPGRVFVKHKDARLSQVVVGRRHACSLLRSAIGDVDMAQDPTMLKSLSALRNTVLFRAILTRCSS